MCVRQGVFSNIGSLEIMVGGFLSLADVKQTSLYVLVAMYMTDQLKHKLLLIPSDFSTCLIIAYFSTFTCIILYACA